MQADEAGDHRVPCEVQNAGAVGDLDLGIRADGGDPAVPDQDGPAAGRRTARPVHDLHAGERHHRLADLDELAHGIRECLRLLCGAREGGDENGERGNEEPHPVFLHLRRRPSCGTGDPTCVRLENRLLPAVPDRVSG